MRSSTTYTRDAALRKLARINRWMIAGMSVVVLIFFGYAICYLMGQHPSAAAGRNRQ